MKIDCSTICATSSRNVSLKEEHVVFHCISEFILIVEADVSDIVGSLKYEVSQMRLFRN